MAAILIKPARTIVERIDNQFPGQQISQFAEELDETDKIVEVWPKLPPGQLHVIVTMPGEVGNVGELTAHDTGIDFFSSSCWAIWSCSFSIQSHPTVRYFLMWPIHCIWPCGNRTSKVV